MIRTMSVATKRLSLAIGSVLILCGMAMASDRDDHGRDRGGFVVVCSLDGVNPAYHPEVFANAATARSMGFVRAPDGVWHVLPGCRR
ncbi:MAG TPA: hypothetical protein VKW08_05585 [Xanthobacteraceae bacterium]|nr:hypothetical protein [Xanthobacteraceae bacterium]